MITSKVLDTYLYEVPDTWIFEYYCGLAEPLLGQTQVIRSVFNPQERTASLKIFASTRVKKYLFKCFSTGKSGSAITFVMDRFDLTYKQALLKIKKDYDKFSKDNKGLLQISAISTEIHKRTGYKVTDYKVRMWTKDDASFWTPFNIGTTLLKRYNVQPIEFYIMSNDSDSFIVSKDRLYGYFQADGTLIKIYRPGTEVKFINVNPTIQGVEQLSGHNYLLIQSSLKDIMSTASLQLKIDCVAPDSENIIIPKSQIEKWRKEYEFIGVLFDNDEAGIKGMQKYKDLYDLTPVLLPLSKDVADSVRDHKPKVVKSRLVPILDQARENSKLVHL